MGPIEPITLTTQVSKPKALVWRAWTDPDHIVNWNFASADWHCPSAECDLRPQGRFNWRMEARDGSMGFDLTGQFDEVQPPDHLAYHLDDGRRVTLDLFEENGITYVTETFEPESSHPIEFQREGWQAILDNFAKYSSQIDR